MLSQSVLVLIAAMIGASAPEAVTAASAVSPFAVQEEGDSSANRLRRKPDPRKFILAVEERGRESVGTPGRQERSRGGEKRRASPRRKRPPRQGRPRSRTATPKSVSSPRTR